MTSGNGDILELSVPDMADRQDVRRVSASIADVPEVVALEVDVVDRSVRVIGSVTVEAVRAALAAAGYRSVRRPAALQ